MSPYFCVWHRCVSIAGAHRPCWKRGAALRIKHGNASVRNEGLEWEAAGVGGRNLPNTRGHTCALRALGVPSVVACRAMSLSAHAPNKFDSARAAHAYTTNAVPPGLGQDLTVTGRALWAAELQDLAEHPRRDTGGRSGRNNPRLLGTTAMIKLRQRRKDNAEFISSRAVSTSTFFPTKAALTRRPPTARAGTEHHACWIGERVCHRRTVVGTGAVLRGRNNNGRPRCLRCKAVLAVLVRLSRKHLGHRWATRSPFSRQQSVNGARVTSRTGVACLMAADVP